MKLLDILKKNCIRYPLQSSDKFEIITELIQLLSEFGQLNDRDQVLESVLARERTRSTGIGLGLAVPHGKSHGLDHLAMAIGKPKQPIDFDTVDGRPCSLVVLLASPADKTGPHIQALAGVSRLWQTDSFRSAVAQAQSAEDLYAAIESHQG